MSCTWIRVNGQARRVCSKQKHVWGTNKSLHNNDWVFGSCLSYGLRFCAPEEYALSLKNVLRTPPLHAGACVSTHLPHKPHIF